MDLGSWGLWGLFIGTFLAATVVPFSSDALFVGVILASDRPLACLLVATLGNWLGSVLSYWVGWLGRWEWIEKWFKVKRETLDKQKRYLDKYGVWVALASWVPFIGDVFPIALGFYRTKPLWTHILLLIGKGGRFVVWALILGAI